MSMTHQDNHRPHLQNPATRHHGREHRTPQDTVPKKVLEQGVTGTLAKYNGTFGFLKRDDGLPDVFVHSSAFETGHVAAQKGSAYQFDVVPGNKAGRTQANDLVLKKV